MHLLAAVLIPFGPEHSSIKPLAARDAAVWARLDTLLFQYQQPDDDWTWGVDQSRGFQFDWWELGGRYDELGREVRSRLFKEAALQIALSHESIVRVFHFEPRERTVGPYIIMEYVP